MHRPRIDTMNGLGEITPAEWNGLAGASHPFTTYSYLHALEASGSAGSASGWSPAHLVARGAQQVTGALPLYRKFNSYGEFVFDFAWADACQRAGLAYYPKLLTAIPFTPVTGPRLLGDSKEQLIKAGLEHMQREEILSWHVLFPDGREHETWKAHGFLPRMNIRLVWSDNNYGDFEGFLAALKQKRRKEIRRERKQVIDAGVTFRVLEGEIDETTVDDVYHCYSRTYLLRGQLPYLTREFFASLTKQMNDSLVIFLGEKNNETLAAAICLRDAKTLYGRWWGARADLPGLHFETCYYQGIAFCLEHGLTRYDPGVQGEHKIARGFAPEPTWSLHRFNHPGLESAVRAALVRETAMIKSYIAECNKHLPFRNSE